MSENHRCRANLGLEASLKLVLLTHLYYAPQMPNLSFSHFTKAHLVLNSNIELIHYHLPSLVSSVSVS